MSLSDFYDFFVREVVAVKAKTIELEDYLTNLKSKLTARSESLNQENALAGSFE